MNFEVIKKLDETAKKGTNALTLTNHFEKTFTIARVAQDLRNLLTSDMMKPIMELQGIKLGFKTDKRYSEDIVRDCLIEATINGVYPVGNMFNIIAGNFYVTKEGFTHKLKQIEGLSYSVTPGIPKTQTGGAVVEVELEWTYKGKKEKKVLPLAIRVNSGMGSDAINGKAMRKALSWLFTTITGQSLGEGDVSDLDIITVTPVKEETKSKFEKEVEVKPTELI